MQAHDPMGMHRGCAMCKQSAQIVLLSCDHSLVIDIWDIGTGCQA